MQEDSGVDEIPDDDPDEMDPGDEIGDLDGVDPHRIEPAAPPPDEGNAESEDARRGGA